MKAMKSLTSKAQKLALLLGVTGVVFTALPSQAEAGEKTLLKSHGLTLNACRIGSRMLRFSGFHSASARRGFLSGSVTLSSRSFGTVRLTQGRWYGDWRGGVVYLNKRYVRVSRNLVSPIHVQFTKGFNAGRGTVYVGFGRTTGSFTMSGLPRCN
ncbi:MAG: hypothetical protein Q4B17_12245 [Lautropia sp.]|nr:hypothetical protein [Lautropia sp.]